MTKTRFTILTLTTALILSATSLWAAEKEFASIFDGKTLKGWTQRNGIATYRVEDGAIVGRTAKSSPNSVLCSDKAYCDFDLIVELKVDPGLNSGI
ncbi:MAG: DUF1080 domain-containing protein, partial [Thermoguttaceae bacterium]